MASTAPLIRCSSSTGRSFPDALPSSSSTRYSASSAWNSRIADQGVSASGGNARTEAGGRGRRGQSHSGLGSHRTYSGIARAAELRDPRPQLLKRGIRPGVGLQARQAPAIEFVQELLSDGYLGEVLSTTMMGLSTPGDVVVQPNAYMLDKTNGANLITISLGHSLDMLNVVLGEFAALSAVSDLRRPRITIAETGEQIVKTAADQIAVIGTLTSGATASIHIRQGVAGG